MKKLSILVPVYNVEPFLNDFLESLIDQVNQDVEVLFCDDCSTDNSLKILIEHEEKCHNLKVFKLEKNSGVAEARNLLLTKAGGNYIWFVDPDDVILPKTIDNIFTKINEYTEADIIIADYILWNGGDLEKVSSFLGPRNCEVKNDNNMFLYNVTMSRKNYIWNHVYKKTLVDKIFFKNHRRFQDMYYMTDISKRCYSYVYIDQCFIKYRIRNNSNTTSNKTKNYIDDYLGAFIYRNENNVEKSKKCLFGIQYKIYSSYVGFLKIILRDKNLSDQNKLELINYIIEKYSPEFYKIYLNVYSNANIFMKISLIKVECQRKKILKEYSSMY